MNLRERLAIFMRGRYGSDRLSRALSYAVLILLVIALIVKKSGGDTAGALIWWAAFGVVVWNTARFLSKNAAARSAENDKYLAIRARFASFAGGLFNRAKQRGTYCVFICPGCGQKVRIPRGKGKIRITCPRCGVSFIKKS